MAAAAQGVGINDELFWGKVRKTRTCWLWTGGFHDKKWKYGWLTRKNIQYTAPRYSWIIHKGPIPKGAYILHRCDNPQCVRPSHLWLGSHAKNMADMKRKGRKLGINGARRGESHGMAKLTEHNVKHIRKLCAAGIPQRKVAKRFHTTQANVWYIKSRKAWQHV